jgi:two-component system cell cycle sensor histidine kinase/response regulator CckA
VTTEGRDHQTPTLKTVLLVEDDSHVRNSLTMGLAALQKYKILEAGSGDEALAICQSYKGVIDVVVVDVVMPKMWGNELAVRLAIARPQTPVLYISGRSEEELIASGILTGRESFLPKPFDAKDLSQKMEEIFAATTPLTRPNPAGLPTRKNQAYESMN